MNQVISAVILLALCSLAPHQDSFEIRTPFNPSSLSGVVIDQTGSELPGVRVERLSPDKKSVQDERVTDANGSFRFSGTTRGKHSLKLSKAGWSTLYVTVIVRKKAKSKLALTMSIAR